MSSTPASETGHEPPPKSDTVTEMWLSWMRAEATERRRERFWRNVRAGLLAITMLGGPLYLAWYSRDHGELPIGDRYAALVRIDGIIGADTLASARRIVKSLERAFADDRAQGVILLINSPGGSPVQSSVIRDQLISLHRSYPQKNVWAIGEDMLTSGAYFVAVGAPHICVDASTLTGSIGVIQEGWGFDRVLDRLAIERRVFTAGNSKNRLDQFLPLQPDDKRKAQTLLNAVHERFKSVVREGRGSRLHAGDDVLYSGDFWTGAEAVKLGLVDRLCSLSDVLVHEFGVTEFKDYTLPPSLLESVAHSFGMQAVAQWRAAVSAPRIELLPP